MAQTRSRLHKKKFRAAGVHGKRHVDRPAHGVIANKRGLGHAKSPFIVYRKDTVMQKYGSRLPRYVPSKPHLYVVSCLASLLTMPVVLLPESLSLSVKYASAPMALLQRDRRQRLKHFTKRRLA